MANEFALAVSAAPGPYSDPLDISRGILERRLYSGERSRLFVSRQGGAFFRDLVDLAAKHRLELYRELLVIMRMPASPLRDHEQRIRLLERYLRLRR